MKFDNNEITLLSVDLITTGRFLYKFEWKTDGVRKQYISPAEVRCEAISDFRQLYPESKGCFISEVKTKQLTSIC